MWTFQRLLEDGEKVSVQRFSTVESAAFAAANWLITCAENDSLEIVQLVRVEDEDDGR
jgi:hypothetical protein